MKCIDEEIPFEIPTSWSWARFGNLIDIKGGKRLPAGYKLTDNKTDHIYIRVSDMQDGTIVSKDLKYITDDVYNQIQNYTIGKDDLYLTIVGSTIGKAGLVPKMFDNMNLTENAVKLTNIPINKYFLLYYVRSGYAQSQFRDNTKQVGQPKLAIFRIANTLVPIPPFAEQTKIVSKIEYTLHLVNHFSNLQEQLHDIDTDIYRDLKKSILQEAIQGKLVPQDPNDEPASVLLERIRAEKGQLIKAGKIKRDKHESFIFRRDNSYYEKVNGIERCIDDELPFEIPESWKWCRLKSLTENITSGSRDWAKYYSTTGAAFLRMGNLSKNSFDLRLEHIQRVTIPSKAEGTRTSLQSGDLLFSITGDVGMLGLIPDGFEKAYINQHTAMIRFLPEMRNKYIPYLLLTDYAQKFYNANQHGIKNSFRLDSIGELLVSIPPEKELFRILQRISLVLSKIAVL